MSNDLLASAAAALGIPESLTKRSAEARAKAAGIPVEEVLRAWSGGGAVAAAPAGAPEPERVPAPAAPAATPPPAPVEAAAPVVTGAEAAVPVASAVEAAVPVASAAEAAAAAIPPALAPPVRPVPESIGLEEIRDSEVVTSTPTAGLKERTRTRIPAWLTVLFLVIPLAAILYLLLEAGGPVCGESGLLAVDRATGEVVNCDGTPFEGRGAPGGTTDFLTRGQTLYTDTKVACSGCHGNNGEGGVGPAFAGGAVLTTFPACADHVSWVQLGSSGWQAQIGPEYGATNKLSQGGMPGFGDALSDEDLRSVVLFERVRFGGAPLEETLIDCGLVVPEAPTEGTAPTGEGTTPTTGG